MKKLLLLGIVFLSLVSFASAFQYSWMSNDPSNYYTMYNGSGAGNGNMTKGTLNFGSVIPSFNIAKGIFCTATTGADWFFYPNMTIPAGNQSYSYDLYNTTTTNLIYGKMASAGSGNSALKANPYDSTAGIGNISYYTGATAVKWTPVTDYWLRGTTGKNITVVGTYDTVSTTIKYRVYDMNNGTLINETEWLARVSDPAGGDDFEFYNSGATNFCLGNIRSWSGYDYPLTTPPTITFQYPQQNAGYNNYDGWLNFTTSVNASCNVNNAFWSLNNTNGTQHYWKDLAYTVRSKGIYNLNVNCTKSSDQTNFSDTLNFYTYSQIVDTFSDGTSSKNLSFTSAGSQYVNLSLPRDANVSSGNVLASGFKGNYTCGQETPNISSDCGGLNTGIYSYDVTYWLSNHANMFDTNWASGGTLNNSKAPFTTYVYINYSKPNNTIGSTWRFSYSTYTPDWNIYENSTPNLCFNKSTNEFRIKINCESVSCAGASRRVDSECYNGSEWINLYGYNNNIYYGLTIAEENITWIYESYTSNLTINLNNQLIYQNLSEFNGSTNVDLNTTILNDCINDSLVTEGNNVLCELNFTSATAGILQLSDLNITYTDIKTPSLYLEQYINNTFINTNSLNFTYNVTDGSDLKNCTLYINTLINKTTTIITNNISQNLTTTLQDGVYNWSISCYDGDNTNQSETRILTVDTSYPQILFSGDTISNNVIINRNFIYINVTTSDTNEANITFYLFNSSKNNINTTTFTAGTRSMNFTSLSDGIYHYNVSIIDYANNKNSTETRNITLDTLFPSLQIISPTNNTISNNNSMYFIYNVTDGNSIKNCTLRYSYGTTTRSYVNTSVTTGILSNWLRPDLTDFVYYWNISCYDGGNTNISENRVFTIDATAPIWNQNNSNITSSKFNDLTWFSINWSDSLLKVNYTWFSIQNLSGWYNFTPTASGSQSQIFNTTYTLDMKRGNVFNYTFYANDTTSNINRSDIYSYTIANTIPTLTSITKDLATLKEGTTQTILPTNQNDADTEGLYIYCCQDTTNACTPTSANTCNNNQAWSSPYSSTTCTLTAPSVSALTTYYSRCRTYDSYDYSLSTVSTSYTVYECAQNSDCSAGNYCNESQSCSTKKSHALTCDLNDLYLDGDGVNTICSDGLCNAGYCNNLSIVTQVNITSAGSNRSNESLSCSFSYTDSNNDNSTKNITYWYNNSLIVTSLENLTTINYTYIKKNQNWTCGILTYDGYNWSTQVNSSNLTILNTPPTTPYLITPANTLAVAYNWVLLKYNSTDIDNWTDTLRFYVYNSTDNTNFQLLFSGSGFQNSTYNWTNLADTTYYWKVGVDDGFINSSNSSSQSFSISTTSPAITLTRPTNNQYFNTRNISTFNFTATDPDNVSVCSLYTNAGGSWVLNQTLTNIINGNNYYFNYTPLLTDENSYKYNVWCNDSLNNGGYSSTNYTFFIDTVQPSTTLTSPTNTTYSSLSISLQHNESDYSLNTCQYNYVISGATTSNTSVSCNSNQTINLTAYGTYTFNYYVLDSANNVNSISREFTVSAPVTVVTTGGGGGGGEPKLKECNISVISSSSQEFSFFNGKDSNLTFRENDRLLRLEVVSYEKELTITPSYSIKDDVGINIAGYVEAQLVYTQPVEITLIRSSNFTLNQSKITSFDIKSNVCRDLSYKLDVKVQEPYAGTLWKGSFSATAVNIYYTIINFFFYLFGV